MKTVRSQQKIKTTGKIEKMQKLYFIALARLYFHTKTSECSQQSLMGIRVAIKKLEDLWQEQKQNYKEIREISDEECPSPDAFFEDDQVTQMKQSLPTILENDEDNSTTVLQNEIDQLWALVSRLKEAENKVQPLFGLLQQIIERYKCELKLLAMDLKQSEEKVADYEEQLKDKSSAYSSSQQIIDEDNKKLNSNQTKKQQCSHKLIQTDQENTHNENYLQLYEQEKNNLNKLERKFEQLKEQYIEMQESLRQKNSQPHQNHDEEDDEEDDDDDEFKKLLCRELESLKKKIQTLTNQANVAEKLLIEKDQKLKDLQKSHTTLQQEFTQKRAEFAVVNEEKKTLEANLKVIQNINRKMEIENQKLNQALHQQKQQALNESKEEKPVKNDSKNKNYKTLSLEIQQLTYENGQLKNQIQNLQRRYKESTENEQYKKESERTQIQLLNQEIENLRAKSIEQQHIIFEYEQMEEENQQESQTLQEAMEYLEMKDKEIEKLRRELDKYRLSKNKVSPEPQVKDLQNLLMVMSKQLKDKEQEINQLKMMC